MTQVCKVQICREYNLLLRSVELLFRFFRWFCGCKRDMNANQVESKHSVLPGCAVISFQEQNTGHVFELVRLTNWQRCTSFKIALPAGGFRLTSDRL